MYLVVLLVSSLIFNGCTPSPRYASNNSNHKKTKYKKTKKTKYKKVEIGISSYYGTQFHGNLTANGEVYDMYGVTAAHKTLPLGTVARITNLENNKSIILRINDRGPYVGNRILDCSYGAATKLDFVSQGTTKVKIEVIEIGDGKYMHHK
tara:strand:- start:30 stop:479 length:450 start_codon:yes stop_codon:yes gene_type:complete